jgi:hypothetical protein
MLIFPWSGRRALYARPRFFIQNNNLVENYLPNIGNKIEVLISRRRLGDPGGQFGC